MTVIVAPDGSNQSDDLGQSVWVTLRRGLSSVPELRRGLGFTLALAVFSALGRLVVPLIIGRAIDKGFTDGRVDMAFITRLVGLGLVVVLMTTAAAQWSHYRLNVRAEQALAALRRSSVDRILRLSIQQHGDTRRGVLVARLTSDVETLSQFFSWGAVAWILDGTTIAVAAVAMLVVDVRLGLIAIVMSLPMLLVFRHLQKSLVEAYGSARLHVGDYLGRISEAVGASQLIRGYGATHEIRVSTRVAIAGRRDASIRAGKLSAILGVSSDVFGTAIVTVCLVVALRLGPASGLSAGAVVTFMLLVTRYLEPFGELAEVVDQTQLASSGMTRILDLIDLPDDVVRTLSPLTLPAGGLSVVLDEVSFSYPSRAETPDSFALRNLSLRIKIGETVAIVGATGSGKSTLAKLIVRTADPTSGTVQLGGVDIARVDPVELRRRVQLVPQEPFLFDTTIAENVAMAAVASTGELMSTDQVDAVLRDFGLGDWLDGMREGSLTRVGERGALLSAGERQLIALARSRVANPDVIVLDEATSSVDAVTENRLAETLQKLGEGRTTIVIAHRLTTVLRADRVVVLEAGRIVEAGTPSELSNRPDGVFAGLLKAWERAENSESTSS